MPGTSGLDYCANSEIWKLYRDLMPGKSEKTEDDAPKAKGRSFAGKTTQATDHLMDIMSEMDRSTSQSVKHVISDLWNICEKDDGRRAARNLEKIIESMGPTPSEHLTSDRHLGNQEYASVPQAIKREPLTTVKLELMENGDLPSSQSIKMEGFPVKIKLEPLDRDEAEVRTSFTANENEQPANPTPRPATVPVPSPYPPKWYIKAENCFGEIVGKWV